MAEVDDRRLLHEIVALGWRAAIAASGHGDVEVLEGLIPLARFVGDNPVRLLVATGVRTDEEIVDYLIEEARQNRPPPT